MGTTIRSVWTAWLLGWFGMLVLALLNGTFRALFTQPLLGETAARVLATVLLLAALTAYVWWLHLRRPIPSARQAWAIGSAWVAMTLTFEFGWGRLGEGLSWSTMFADYDVTAGRIWVLVPLWTAVLPAVVRQFQATHRGAVATAVAAHDGAAAAQQRLSALHRAGSPGTVPSRRADRRASAGPPALLVGATRADSGRRRWWR
jgi:hypothetical protein